MIKCIIVDDEPLAIAQLEKYVERVPFLENVKSCSCAAEALEFLSCESVDVMFVDINMPDIQLLAVALLNANNHVVQQSTGQTMQALVQMLFVGTLNGSHIAFDLQDHVGVEGVGQLALGALHGDNIAFGNIHSDICRNDNRLLTNSRHSAFLLTKRKPGLRRRCAAREPSCRS